MDLTAWLPNRYLRPTPRPLVVTALGGRAVRLAVERTAREWGWEQATSPAEADLLVVCGAPDSALAEAVERVWAQLPSPRARVDLRSAADVTHGLVRARARLADREQQRADSAARIAPAPTGTRQDEHDEAAAAGHGEHEMAAGHGEHEMAAGHGEHEMAAGHGVHEMAAGHGEHEMAAGHGEHAMSGGDTGGGHDMHMTHGGEVAGLPMADRAPDRDGLTLDQLHVTLGPVLADWPAGLTVRLTLQGDVVQSAQVDVARAPSVPTRTVDAARRDGRCARPPGDAASSGDDGPAVAALDGLGRLLAVCGASTAARTARRLRDDLLAGTVDDAELRRFARRLRRSRTLRWATDGVGRLDERHGELGGDATRRWRRWVDVAEGAGAAGDPAEGARVALAELPGLLEGTELAAARVVVASLDPDLDVGELP